MSTGTTPSSDEALDASADRPDPRRWKALALLGFVQFMFVIDMTVVSVALPRIQGELDMSRTGLAWVVNGYVLMAGGLLLFGGRLADLFGRRRIFITGVVIFAVASVISGAAMNPEMLIYSRFLQGVGEALAAPAALGIVFLLFSAPADRVKAVGIWGGLSGLAGTLGPVVGGLIVADASWRWIFYVNVPVAVIALALVGRLVGETRMERTGQKFNFTGVLTATARSGRHRLRPAPGRRAVLAVDAGAAAALRWAGVDRADAADRVAGRRTADPAALLHQPHPRGGLPGRPGPLLRLLRVHLPDHPLRAAGARLLAAQGRSLLPSRWASASPSASGCPPA